MKKKKWKKLYLSFYKGLDAISQDKLNHFFDSLKQRLTLSKKDRKTLRIDFEKAFVKYQELGISLDRALELLDLTNLGGFYSRPCSLWLPLDDSAKSYCQWVDKRSMSVFRIAVYLKENIYPEFLQMALNFTIKRYPEFAMSIHKGFFWHYLDSIRKRFPIEKESQLPVQRIRLTFTGSKAFRVLYFNNRISVEFFHSMTDGKGAIEFLKTLTSCYLKLLNKNIQNSDLIIDENSVVDSDEFENAFSKINKENKENKFIEEKALQLGGKLSLDKPCRILHFRMPMNRLLEVSRSYGVSITAFIAAKIFNASKRSIDEIDGDISVSIPVNMRKYFPSKTLRNFSLYCHLRNPIKTVEDTKEFYDKICKQLKTHTTEENMVDMMATTANLIRSIKIFPLGIKTPINKSLFKLFGDRSQTMSLSNLGKVDLPEDVSKEILYSDFVLGTAVTNRANCSLISVNNVSTLTITKNTKDPSFEEHLFNLLKEEGIDIEVEGSEVYGR